MIETLTSFEVFSMIVFSVAVIIFGILVVLKVEKDTPTVRDEDEFLGVG